MNAEIFLADGKKNKYPVESVHELTFEDWQKIAFVFFSITGFQFVMLNFLGEMGDILICGECYNGETIVEKLSVEKLQKNGWIK